MSSAIYRDGVPYIPTWKYNELVADHQAPPVIDQWYTVLEASDAMVVSIVVDQLSSDSSSAVIEIELTLDDVVLTAGGNQAHGDDYYVYTSLTNEALSKSAINILPVGYFIPIYARSVKIRYRTTSTDVTDIRMWVRYWSL